MFSIVGLDEIETSFKITKLTQEVTACNLNFSLHTSWWLSASRPWTTPSSKSIAERSAAFWLPNSRGLYYLLPARKLEFSLSVNGPPLAPPCIHSSGEHRYLSSVTAALPWWSPPPLTCRWRWPAGRWWRRRERPCAGS